MKLHYRGNLFPLASLRKDLEEAGAEFLEPTNEWEALRYRYGGKVGIVYRNKKGMANPTGASDPRVGFNRRCDALAKAHSQSLHTERKAAAWARADAARAEMPSAPAS